MASAALPESMRAVRFSAADGVKLTDQPLPVPKDGQALVRVLRAGVCSTDLEVTKGYVPGFDSVMGHEFVGQVVAAQSAPEWVGRRVCGEINFACQKCSICERKDDMSRNHCPNRTVFGIIFQDGCFADYTVVPVANLIEVPAGISLDEAVFVEPLAAACRIAEQGFFTSTDRVAVVGDGKLGLLIAQAIAIQGCKKLTVFGRHPNKMGLVDGVNRVRITSSTQALFTNSFDVCVDATGSSGGISFALTITRPMGTVVQKSTCSATGGAPLSVDLVNTVVVDEIKLVGSRCGPFDVAMRMLSEPAVKNLLKRMVDSKFSLSEGPAALNRARTKGVLKVVIDMEA